MLNHATNYYYLSNCFVCLEIKIAPLFPLALHDFDCYVIFPCVNVSATLLMTGFRFQRFCSCKQFCSYSFLYIFYCLCARVSLWCTRRSGIIREIYECSHLKNNACVLKWLQQVMCLLAKFQRSCGSITFLTLDIAHFFLLIEWLSYGIISLPSFLFCKMTVWVLLDSSCSFFHWSSVVMILVLDKLCALQIPSPRL